MKSAATNIFRRWLLLLALFAYPLVDVLAENSCECQNPSGGRIQCEDQQAAICRVRDGKVNGECKTPPIPASEGKALGAWLLSDLSQTQIRPEDIDDKPELQSALSEGRYTNPKTGEVVTFRLPRAR